MNETTITLVGNVVTEPTTSVTPSGTEATNFRMATTSRRFDRGINQWVDGDTSFVRVTCWRRLARNVAESVAKGDPVVVTGTMKVREWERQDGSRGVSVEVEAASVGHDLARGVTRFTRAAKRDAAPETSPEAPDAAAA